MELFHIIDDVQAIIRCRGVFRQVPIFKRGIDLFVKHGTGFIRLMGNGHTSAPNISWLDIERHQLILRQDEKSKPPVWKG